MFSNKDKEILRQLGTRLREISELPEMEQKRQRWYAHNALKVERPMVLCYPEGAWAELLTDKECLCEDKTARAWEIGLRQKIYHFENIHDDQVIEPIFEIAWAVSDNGFGVDIKHAHGDNRGSYAWEPPIKDIAEDMKKLRFREHSIDREKTLNDIHIAKEIFDGLLEVVPFGGYGWTMGLTWDCIKLVGLEDFMLFMYDDPENLHVLMKWLSDEAMNKITWLEKNGALTINNRGGYVGSGGVAYTNELPASGYTPGGPARLKDLWGFAESQETVGVSPDMFAEFILPYQLPLLEKFGLNAYGCCEPLELRWKHVKTIPNLRRLSISPWCNEEKMVEYMGANYIYSRKPNPSFVCANYDETAIIGDLRHTLEATKGCVVELVMKDTHTVQNDHTRLGKWVKTAYKEIERIYG